MKPTRYTVITLGNFCLLQAYKAGKCLGLLKWKPEELNSVDFKLNIVERSSQGCVCVWCTCSCFSTISEHDDKLVIVPHHRMLRTKVAQLFVGGYKQPFSELDLLDPHNKEARQLSGRIIECMWDKTTSKWKFMRLREDKSFPNGVETAMSEALVIVVKCSGFVQNKQLDHLLGCLDWSHGFLLGEKERESARE